MKLKHYSIIGIVIMFFVAMLISVESALEDGLTHYYNFTTNGTDSVGNVNGTEVNNPTHLDSGCIIGGCYEGDGTGSDQKLDFTSELVDEGSNFSINCWIFPDTISAGVDIFYGQTNAPASLGFSLGRNAGNFWIGHNGVLGISTDESVNINNWEMITYTYDFGNATERNRIYRNTTKLTLSSGEKSSQIATGSATEVDILLERSTNNWDGRVDECGFWNKVLSLSEITDLYNSGNGLQYPFVGIIDTTPPTISNINQTPSNITNLNIVGEFVNITADITDNIQINDSTVFINVTMNNTQIFVNGTQLDNNFTLNFTSKIGNNYLFQLDDDSYLSTTHNIDSEIMEDTDHLNDTLTSNSQWLKMKFFNVSNNKTQVLMEIMDINATAEEDTAEYYYCNSTYSMGNPVSNDFCRLFASVSNKAPIDHVHGKSFYRVIPMGINIIDGTLNGLLVTQTIFILKRGNVGGERYFYIPNITRTDQMQTSNNNGNAWTNLLGTVDVHIHQLGFNESLNYNICASDNSSNKNCSGMFGDIIEFAIFPPNAVDIFNPMEGNFNGSILINHSVSGSASGQDITGYKYEYKITTSFIWLTIIENNFPDTTLAWDISNILNDDYHIRITVTDDLNLTSETISETFTIANPLSITNQLLTTQNQLLTNIFEVLDMIWIVLFIVFFFIAGIIAKQKWIWNFSSLGIIILGGTFLIRTDSAYNVTMAITFLTLGIMFLVVTVILTIMDFLSKTMPPEKEETGYLKYH